MAAPTMKSTSILTEHLQYPPISLVDDIINAVNEVMYKCTAAMERYLMERSIIDGKDYAEDIKIGIANLENILEQSVDRNFDKLELYVLRNVFRIPQDLLDANVFRLDYQRDLIIPAQGESELSQWRLEEKVKEVENALRKNQELKIRISNARTIKRRLAEFRKLVLAVFKGTRNDDRDSVEIRQVIDSLTPLDDSLKLVTLQLRQLYLDSEERVSMDLVQSTHQALQNLTYSRAEYIDGEVDRIFGGSAPQGSTEIPKEEEPIVSSPDLESIEGLFT